MVFKPVALADKQIIFSWLDQPHVKQFWDNSQAHRDDIINFIEGRKVASPYFNGIFDYWIGSLDDQPYAFLLTSRYQPAEQMPPLHRKWLSQHGTTYSIDFCIGNRDYLGKGLAAPTLRAFITFLFEQVDPRADTFFIDPSDSNPRAIHVYQQAGFVIVGRFAAEEGFFQGDSSLLMVKTRQIEPTQEG